MGANTEQPHLVLSRDDLDKAARFVFHSSDMRRPREGNIGSNFAADFCGKVRAANLQAGRRRSQDWRWRDMEFPGFCSLERTERRVVVDG